MSSTHFPKAPRIPRYSDVAVLLHWMMALLIIGLLAFGKYTHSLDPSSGSYYALIQLHKSFGITVLLLAVLRVVWRISHTPPDLPATHPRWQHIAASLTHALVYVLMFALPLTGWAMVSVSTLNIDTVLFGVIPWPHLPVLPTLDNRESVEHLFHTLHAQAGHVLIALLLLHIGAALKHRYVDKDSVLQRMLPDWSSRAWQWRFGVTLLGIATVVIGLYANANTNRSAAIVAAGNAEVSFLAGITGYQAPGVFADASVTARLDDSNPTDSVIEARVATASVSSTDGGVDGGIRATDWFDIENYPEAHFISSSINAGETPDTFTVTGTLTIKDIALEVNFPMTVSNDAGERHASGEFTVDRLHFKLGSTSQPDESSVDFAVVIRFRFPLSDADA